MRTYANQLAIAILLSALAFGQGVTVLPKTTILPKTTVFPGTAATNASIVQPTAGNPLAAGCMGFGSSGSCAYPLNVTSGNTAYILILTTNSRTLGTPTLSSGSATLGTITTIGAGGTCGGNCSGQWYSASITGSGSATISETITGGSTDLFIGVYEVANSGGADSGTNPVYANESFCGGTNCTMIAITTATNNDLILYAAENTTTVTFSAVTPYTLSGQGTSPGSGQWMTANYSAPSASTVNGTFSQTSGSSYFDSALAIK